jgi:hypothetical protein
MFGFRRAAQRYRQPATMGSLGSSKGLPTFQYPFQPTDRGDAGAGTRDLGFNYPWLKPELFFVGPGNPVMARLMIAEGNPSYYQLSVTNAPAQGPGNIAGTIHQQQLLGNFYNAGENTAYF